MSASHCRACHAGEAAAWKSSDHARAMTHASAASVLGDFNDARFSYGYVNSVFFRRDGKFFVRTDGPDGKLQDYEVKFTFGVEPLQQYLVELPGGRLQALSLAWDSRPKEQGGQRWFHLYPGERIDHRDPLHWTGLQQNWNFMCAECHSTDLRRNYSPSTKAYATAFSEINVSCEACHGPGPRAISMRDFRRRSSERLSNCGLNSSRPPADRVVKRSVEPCLVVVRAAIARRRPRHHSATAKQYCPSSSTVARHATK